MATFDAVKKAGVWAIKNLEKHGVVATVGTGLMVAGQAAHAALPTAVTTSVNAIQADGEAIFAAVFPAVATLVGLGLIISLFKRFVKKI